MGLVEYDLRRALSPAQKGHITKLWAKAGQFANPNEFASVKVPRNADSGNRARVKNRVFVARDGAQRVVFNPKAGEIVKTRRDGAVIKRIRAKLNPTPEDLDAAFESRKKGRAVMIRSTDANGTAGPGIRYTDAQTLAHYKQSWRARFIDAEVGRLRAKGLNKKQATSIARQNARDVMATWYVVEYEEDDEKPTRAKRGKAKRKS